MQISEALDCGLRIKSDLRGIIALYDDDLFKWVAVSEAEQLTGIHRTTILWYMKKNPCLGQKMKGKWYLRLKLLSKIILKYRYGELGTRNGKRWEEDELSFLYSPLSHREASQKLNRSYNAIKTKRSKIKCSHIN